MGSTALRERAAWCLDARRGVLESLVDQLARADAAVLQKAVPAAVALESVADCRDAAALARQPDPPVDRRDEVRAVRADIARLGSLQAAGRFKELAQLAPAVQARAAALAWPPLDAEASFWVARALELDAKWPDAAKALEDAGFAAFKAGALGVAADAAIGLTTLVGQKLARFEDGLRWARFAELAVAALEPHPGLRTAARLNNLGLVRGLTGAFVEARALQEQALAIQEATLGPDHLGVAYTLQNLTHTHLNAAAYPEALAVNERALTIREAVLGPDHTDVGNTLSSRAVILRHLGKFPEALELARRALAITETALGPDHPNVAAALTNLANIQQQIRITDDLTAWQERALAIRERSLGPDHPDVAASLSNLGGLYMQTGQLERGRTTLLRALEIREKVFGPEHREVATSLTNLAYAEQLLGAPARARQLQERALKILEKAVGPEHPSISAILVGLAELDRDAGDITSAHARHTRALAIIEKTFGPDHPSTEQVLVALAEDALTMGRPADAVALAGRAVTSGTRRGADAASVADSRFTLAKALWEAPAGAGRDRGRALTEARTALAAVRAAAAAERAAEIERWLAKHRG